MEERDKMSLRVGRWIKCSDEVDVRKTLALLSVEGYHAVRCAANYILITGMPEGKEREDAERS